MSRARLPFLRLLAFPLVACAKDVPPAPPPEPVGESAALTLTSVQLSRP